MPSPGAGRIQRRDRAQANLAHPRSVGGVVLHLIPNIRYGTEGYPDKVARRLRALNITTWAGATLILLFGLLRLFDRTTPFTWQLAVANLVAASILIAL